MKTEIKMQNLSTFAAKVNKNAAFETAIWMFRNSLTRTENATHTAV